MLTLTALLAPLLLLSSYSQAIPLFLEQSLLKQQQIDTADTNSKFNKNPSTIHSIHSHNDYWRKEPLFTALNLGIPSVEADVWSYKKLLGDETLYVGHNLLELRPDRTLQSLYIDPIYNILDERNSFTDDDDEEEDVGIFKVHPKQPLYLLIDLKTAGEATYNEVYQALEPLRSRGWLTTFDQETQTMKQGLVTVIGSGNTPLHKVLGESQRDLFFDAPLGHLNSTFTPEVSPYASASMNLLIGSVGGAFSTDGLNQYHYNKLQGLINDAHSRGLKSRIWDTPTFPRAQMTKIWLQIVEMGSDILNADDLELAVQYA